MSNSKNEPNQKRSRPPATTPDGRENQVIAKAMYLAEKQILDGTASSQVITHFLKLGSSKERLEKEILVAQKENLAAKTESLKTMKNMEEIYTKAIDALKTYRPQSNDDEDY